MRVDNTASELSNTGRPASFHRLRLDGWGMSGAGAWHGRVALVCVAIVGFPFTAGAFTIWPTVHQEITNEASLAAGWNQAARDQLQNNVVAVDTSEAWPKPFPHGPIQPTAAYRASHHFDRNPGVLDEDAFRAGAAYVREKLELAAFLATAGLEGKVVRLEAARGLHALEDFFSHSNYVDLEAEDRQDVYSAIWDGNVALPASLEMTGYNNAPAKKAKPGLPPDDPRQHDLFALDEPDMNDYAKEVIPFGCCEAARHVWARWEASAAATDFLERLNDAVPALHLPNIRVASAAEAGADESSYQWAALQAYDPGGFTAAYGGNFVQFPALVLSEEVRAGIVGRDVSVAGHEDDALVTPTGERLAVFREIRPVLQAFDSPLSVHLQYELDEVDYLRPGTLQVFFADPDSDSWVPVPGAYVQEYLGEVSFSATHGGLYAIGGVAIPEPGTLALMLLGALGLLPAVRRHLA